MFIVRGIGAGIGAILSSKLYIWISGRVIASIALFLLAGGLLCIPLNTSIGSLHVNFFVIGLLTSVINSGSQIMTRRLHGAAAGPWLGANTIAFGVSGAISPLIGWLTGAIIVEYSVLAAVTFCIAFFLVVIPKPDTLVGALEVRWCFVVGRKDWTWMVLAFTYWGVIVGGGGDKGVIFVGGWLPNNKKKTDFSCFY